MIEIKIKHNFASMLRQIDGQFKKQIPYATSRAINNIAKTAQREVVAEMRDKFDRPTPFTLNSTFIKFSTKHNLTARIYIKDRELAKSKALADSIGHQFSGGSRIRSRLEYWLSNAGYITSSEFVVPASGAKLDQYGNLSRGSIAKILSQLRAGPDAASYRTGSARSKSKRALAGYFWSRGGKLARGVWERTAFAQGSAVKPVLIVIKSPSYRQRINMDAIGIRVINRDFQSEFTKQFNQAVRTAR